MSQDEMEGQVVDVGSDPPLAAEICVGENDESIVILILHSGLDQLRFHGLDPAHAKLIALAVNAPLENSL